jgi:aminomethyltransferase
MQNGRQFGIRNAGMQTLASLRLEKAYRDFGVDIDNTDHPIEAGLGFAISKRRKLERGFPGADRLMAQLLEGPARRRVGLALEGKLPAREGAAVLAGDQEIGVVTSGGFAPSLGAPIAMAYVAAGHAADGTTLSINVRGKLLPAVVVPMPFKTKNYVREQGGMP